MKSISTPALSKQLGISSKDIFDVLLKLELIFRKNDKWSLTPKDESVGGKITSSEKYGDFITWPENFRPIENTATPKGEFYTATKLDEKFGISNQRVNNIPSELGGVGQVIKG
jgi:hypothetical protein